MFVTKMLHLKIETIASIAMLDKDVLVPTLNLENIDPLCEGVRYVRQIEKASLQNILKNNFALGGVNTCIIIRRYGND